jgi:PAT family beta-lactamase induction signal transducer AmpG
VASGGIGVFTRRHVAVLAPLGFAAGLPVVLTGGTLEAWLASESVDIRTIGLMSLIGLPYAFKFLWAPLLDRVELPLGRRRGWIAASQLAVALALLATAAAASHHDLARTAALGVLISILSATHIAAIDAYRTDVLAPAERGAGAASYLIGFRIGGVCAGGLALVLASVTSFAWVYVALAMMLAAGVVVTLIAPAPERPTQAPDTWSDAVRGAFSDYAQRPGAVYALLLVLTYRLGEALAAPMITPMLIAHGYSLATIGWASKAVGIASAVVGGVVGGAIVARWYLRSAMLLFGLLATASNVGYLVLAITPHSIPGLAVAVAIDNALGAMAMAAFIAWLMSLCNTRYSAAQYALIYGIYAAELKLAGASSGFLVAALGWPTFFAITMVVALPGLLLLARLPPRLAMPTHGRPQDA